MTENDKFILACVNLGLELKSKNRELLTQMELKFLRALNKQSIVKTDEIYNITFKKPYKFKEEIYYDIDISDIENYSNQQLEKFCNSSDFYIGIVSEVTKQPLEFFNNMPASEYMKIRAAVRHRFKKEENSIGISIIYPINI